MRFTMLKISRKDKTGYSLIELMSVLSILGIVLGLLYAYSDQGWRLFYQSYGRGLSHVKAKLAIKILSDELREANKNRIEINSGNSYGAPIPDDTYDNSPYIYFTKPKIYEPSGDVIGYDYILYYFAKPQKKDDYERINTKRKVEKQNFLILKSVRFKNQSKSYTEDNNKTWPFMPPILEVYKSILPEDEAYIESLKASSANANANIQTEIAATPAITDEVKSQETLLDHYEILKRDKINLPISGNFSASSLTEPFSKNQISINFGQDYKFDKPITIKLEIEESVFLLGLMGAMSNYEVEITPRN